MKISLILATLNREELAYRAIESVLRQTFQDWEIIIVDQTDVPCQKLMNIDSRIIYKHIDVKGLSHARNIGIGIATGDIIGLMDDDAEYEEDALSLVSNYFKRDDNIWSVYGKLVDPRNKEAYIKDNKELLVSWSNFMSICISACSFIRKSFFDSYSFDESLGVGCYMGSAEESDVFAKLLQNKAIGYFNSSIVIYHPVPTPEEAMKSSNLNKHKSYCRGFGGFCAKHIYKFKSREVGYVYLKAMARTTCGFILAALRFNRHKCEFYKTTLSSRREGFRIYREMLKSNNDRGNT